MEQQKPKRIRVHNAERYAEKMRDPEYAKKHRERKAKYRAEKKKDPEYVKKERERAAKHYAAKRNNTAFRLKEYKEGAQERGLEFTISDEFACALFNDACAYCGHKKEGELNGIDRYDNNRGYVPGNCLPCCAECNFAKRAMTANAFLTMCHRVTTHSETIAARLMMEATRIEL